MLLRNLNAASGLLNGTRLIAGKMYDDSLDLGILTDRILDNGYYYLTPFDATMSSSFERQFPATLAFCITINKAQGQTFDLVVNLFA